MQTKGSNNRLSGLAYRSRISTLMLSMIATMACFYVAGRLEEMRLGSLDGEYVEMPNEEEATYDCSRALFAATYNKPSSKLLKGSNCKDRGKNLWQDSQNRVYLIKELDRITGQGRSAISVDDTLKIISCREQKKKLIALQMELIAARQEGFTVNHLSESKRTPKKRPLVIIGIMTGFGHKNNRDAIRKAWMGTGANLKKMEDQKGVIVRFVIGRSANRGDSSDRGIDNENKQTDDFFILENHVEAPEELPKKAKLFFAHAVENWDAEFYAKLNDDVYVNIDALGNSLTAHLDEPRAYIGCMKSGEVFSEQSHKWYEPDWWKFGDRKGYFRHASGEMIVISQALAKFISINRSILRTYAHDDVSVGSWFIGLDVKHVDDKTFCCSSWSSGAICAGV